MPKYHCFEVRLLGVESKLWRRILLRADGTLWDVHQAIQTACGWSGGHLFAFLRPRGREVIAGVPDRGMGDRYPHARRVPIADVFEGEAKRTCIYQYDFGDDWRHEVTLVETVSHAAQLTSVRGALPWRGFHMARTRRLPRIGPCDRVHFPTARVRRSRWSSYEESRSHSYS